MASYHSPQRPPLLDSRLQAVIQQRGTEILGMVLIMLGVMMALILASYSPDDPSWMAATDEPVRNALGRVGATIAAPMTIILGRAGWGVVLALCVWGLRLVIHRGEGTIPGRLVFLPIAVAVTAVWLATLVPGPGWGMDFGLGGMFGDTVLGALLTALPLGSATGINLLTLTFFTLAVLLWGYVLGSTWREVYDLTRFLGIGIVLSYAGLVALLAGGGRGLGRGLQRAAAHRAARRAERQAAVQAAAQAMPVAAPHDLHAPFNAAHAGPQGWQHGWQHGSGIAYPGAAQGGDGRHEPSLTGAVPRRDSRVLRADAPTAAPLAAATIPQRDQAPVLRADPRADAGFEAQPPLGGGAGVALPPHQATAWPANAPQPSAAKPGLLARVSALGRRRAEPEVTAAPRGDMPPMAGLVGAEGPDRVKSRISDLIRARQRQTPVLRIQPHSAQPHSAQPGMPTSAVQAPMAPMAGPPHAQPPFAPRPAGLAEPPLRSAPAMAQPHPAAGPGAAFVPAAGAMGAHHVVDGYGGDPYGDPEDGTFAPPPNAVPFTASPAMPQADDSLIDDDHDPAPYRPVAPAEPTSTGHVLNRRVVQTGRAKPPAPSRRAQAEAQPSLRFREEPPAYEPPPLALLSDPDRVERYTLSDDALEENARMLESVLDDYGVRGEIVAVRPGPVVTLYELEPAPGLKASRVIGLADDIARSMSALSARVSTVPGRSVIGIELPNARREKVVLREILACRDFGDTQQRLPIALGKDIGGEPIVANLAKMPHLLIAGTTGSGKSVAINTMILSLLYRLTPAECRLIMIDPKMLELSVYDGIPHLLSPVVTDPKKAVVALKWVVGEMEERYRKMSKMGVRNIEGFNGRVREALERGEMFKRTVQTGFDDETGDPVFETEEFAPEALPFIVVIVDEMADLMMVAGKEIEACIQRLAQMARASGIHLIMATQRPSVDVITGTIKANFPTRISFQVTSKIDSRTILGEMGAEQLLGMGDMLYMAGGAKITRVHGPFVSDEEVEEVVTHLKSFGPPDYQSGVLEGPDGEREADIDAVLGLGDGSGGEDALYDQAVAIVAKDRKCSTSYIQRKLGIGYNKAARLVEQMEEQGVVSPANHVGKREVLVPEA